MNERGRRDDGREENGSRQVRESQTVVRSEVDDPPESELLALAKDEVRDGDVLDAEADLRGAAT
jgi:hypothetical protein